MGSLLAVNSNLSGSIHHYQQALIQNSQHADAYSSLRIITCYHKYHRTVLNAATATEQTLMNTLQSACSEPVARPREAVFICTKVGCCFICKTNGGKVELNVMWLIKFLVFISPTGGHCFKVMQSLSQIFIEP